MWGIKTGMMKGLEIMWQLLKKSGGLLHESVYTFSWHFGCIQVPGARGQGSGLRRAESEQSVNYFCSILKDANSGRSYFAIIYWIPAFAGMTNS